MWEYLKPFNYVETKVTFVYKQICSDSFRNKITYKLLIAQWAGAVEYTDYISAEGKTPKQVSRIWQSAIE